MIYSIQPDIHHYLVPHIDSKEARQKLGADTRFHFDSSPVSYLHQWQPLEVEYYQEIGTAVPDVGMANGRLFLNNRAYIALQALLAPAGEFLPASFEGHTIYIHTIMNIAETDGVLDAARCTFDAHGNLDKIAFLENRFSPNKLYRAEWDCLFGIYCGEDFKQRVEGAQLTGLRFTNDLTVAPLP